jgi:hypothetical protein
VFSLCTIDQYVISVVQTDDLSKAATKAFTGQVGIVNLSTALQPFSFTSGKKYRVTLYVNKVLPNGCESYHSITKTFTMGCTSSDTGGDDQIKTLLVSPNPTTGLVNIQIDLDEQRDMSLQVYDLHTGNLVGTLKAMDTTPAGISTLSWDASPFSDGWYYVRAVTYNQAKTSSFLLQK